MYVFVKVLLLLQMYNFVIIYIHNVFFILVLKIPDFADHFLFFFV